ncbi:MAG: diguanylate cyclase [Betaproteobacteria bacterium]|nr:diguanylate cyclase [Betaproteobacteria bacterium]
MQYQADPLKILLVDDSLALRKTLGRQLAEQGHLVAEALNAEEALLEFAKFRPDLILLDVILPGADGYFVARQIRELEAGQWTPIIFLSAKDGDADLWQGIEAGGDDYLVKPVSTVVLTAKLRAMQRLRSMGRRNQEISEELRVVNAQLRHLCQTDELTGLSNRRGFDEFLLQELRSAQRDKTPLTLILCDVDYFKLFNDTLGHVQGDACLQRIGAILRSLCLRPRDQAARYGGEEFALVLPHTPKSGAMTYARGLQAVLRQVAIAHPGSPFDSKLTLSGGITTCIPDASATCESLILRADEALYAAKALGRNRFFSFEMQSDTTE